MIVHLASGSLDTHFGTFAEHLYYDGLQETIALVMGEVAGVTAVPCRLHSACISAHVFNSLECDCREQMAMSQERIQREGRGIVIWLQHEARANGHLALVATSALRRSGVLQSAAYQQLGFPVDRRGYESAVEVLQLLAPASIILLSNNPEKAEALSHGGIAVAGMEQLTLDPNAHPLLRLAYADKKRRGHKVP